VIGSMGAATDLARRAVDYLLGGPAVGGADEQRLLTWLAMPEQDPGLAHARARYVVVATDRDDRDRRHRATMLAAIAVDCLQIDYAGCFVAPLSPAGTAGATATMVAFAEFLRKSPLAAFDAASERATLQRAVRSLLGVPLRHPWIDIGAQLRAHFGGATGRAYGDWAERFGICCDVREPTLRKAVVSAQLALIALDAAARAGSPNARALAGA
jgi:hypothetical protein